MTDSVLTVEHLSRHFDGMYVLQDVSFEIAEGVCVGLVGENAPPAFISLLTPRLINVHCLEGAQGYQIAAGPTSPSGAGADEFSDSTGLTICRTERTS